jgi:polyferredoxin/Tfp pilus assembly protein PilF
MSLPLVEGGGRQPERTGRWWSWRVAVLLAVHVLIAAHLAHFALAGQTLSPVEPSEAMYTLELGWVNAGAIFFAVALLGTVAFGRFFCGWGCHLVALQDLCGWLLTRLGVRPRAFRSRLLAWFPAALAFYLFGWPTLYRWLLPEAPAHPGFRAAFFTTDFWATFPGPLMAAATFLVCGLSAVYLLGAKGFCTYGCPYGALFGAADRLSPTRIVVSDACIGCGHCTASCTSNVRVHEEVKRHRMVVDSGCMKCLDCVSVCPTRALSLGLVAPPALRPTPLAAAPKTYDVSAAQELVLAVVGVAATLVFRGLYDGPPLLLSATLGVLTAYVAFKVYQLATTPVVTVQNCSLKANQRIRPLGWVFGGLAIAWLGLTAHSGFVQWHRAWGTYHLERTGVTWDQLRAGPGRPPPRSAAQREAAALAQESFAAADRWGLVGVGEVKLGLAWLAILREEPAEAEQYLRAAVALYPRSPRHREVLVEFLLWRGRLDEAIRELEGKLSLTRPTAADQLRLGNLLAEAGRWDDAMAQLRACAQQAPASPEPVYNLGAILRRAGRSAEAVEPLEAARRLSPQDPEVLRELCLAYLECDATAAAAAVIEQAEAGLRDQLAGEPRLRDLVEQKVKR